ncbi:hypothetical protein BC829DRAFT_494851, partial [Chytridium lagenaria]
MSLDQDGTTLTQSLVLIVSILGCGVVSIFVFPHILPFIRPTKSKKRVAVPAATSSTYITTASSQQALKELLSGEDTDTSKKSRRKSEVKKRPSNKDFKASKPVTLPAVPPTREDDDGVEAGGESVDDLILLSKLSSVPPKRVSVKAAASPGRSSSSKKPVAETAVEPEEATGRNVDVVASAQKPAHLDRADSKPVSDGDSLPPRMPEKIVSTKVTPQEEVDVKKVNGVEKTTPKPAQTTRDLPSA